MDFTHVADDEHYVDDEHQSTTVDTVAKANEVWCPFIF